MAVAFADEGGVEVLAAVEIDEAQEPAVGVHGGAGPVYDEANGLAVQPGPGKAGRFQPEMFHGFGGVDRFGRVHSDEPDGAMPARIPADPGIAVNDALDTRRDGPGPLSGHRQYPGEAHQPADPPGPFLPQAPVGSPHGFTSRNVGCGDGNATGL